MKPYQKLQQHWRSIDSAVTTVELSPETVARLEARYGVRLPDDLREYLLHSCPRDDFASDWRNDLE